MTSARSDHLPTITLRKSGTVLDISVDGVAALPPEARRVLEPLLRYDKIEVPTGADRWDPVTGARRTVSVTPKRLYRYDAAGRMVCGFGFYRLVWGKLREAGFAVKIVSTDPPLEKRPRPKCYETDWSAVERGFSFRPRQRECLEAIASAPCGVVHAPTGFGKAVIIAMVCVLYPFAKIHVVTRRRDLVQKLRRFLTRWIPNVGQIGAGEIDERRVTVCTSASLHHSSMDADFLLCDEAHEVIADEASRWLVKYRYTRNFSLTASPEGRHDGADIRMTSLFGPVIFHMPYSEAVSLNLVVPIRVEWSDVKIPYNPCYGMDGVKRERWGIWRNDVRNATIAAKARTFADDEQVQILVRTVEHAVHLKKHLPEYTLVYDTMEMSDRQVYVEMGLISKDEPLMTPQRRDELRQAFERGDLKKVISTNVWAVGIDPVHLTALIRADAASSEIIDIQAPGRVSRVRSGKSVGVVCDFWDQFDPSMARRAKVRYRHYKKLGWEQITVPLQVPNVS